MKMFINQLINASLDLVDNIKEKFCFLHVGQWTKGNYGEDRKDIGKTIKIFYESFANKKRTTRT